jgi:hypothetical protein
MVGTRSRAIRRGAFRHFFLLFWRYLSASLEPQRFSGFRRSFDVDARAARVFFSVGITGCRLTRAGFACGPHRGLKHLGYSVFTLRGGGRPPAYLSAYRQAAGIESRLKPPRTMKWMRMAMKNKVYTHGSASLPARGAQH